MQQKSMDIIYKSNTKRLKSGKEKTDKQGTFGTVEQHSFDVLGFLFDP